MHQLVRIAMGAGLSLAVGCGGAQRGGAPGAAGAVKLLIVQGTTVKILEATPTGLREVRSATVPLPVGAVEWAGGEPVVMLEVNTGGDSNAADAKRNGEIGRITDRGYEPFAALPASTWTVPAPEGMDHFETPSWRLVVGADGAIWQARCEWGYFGDGDECTEYVYARLHPAPAAGAPVTTTREEPKLPQKGFVLPDIPPSQTTQVAIAELPRPPSEEEPKNEATNEPLKILRCTQAGKTIEYPPEDERDQGMDGELTWLSTEPPIYSAGRWESGLDVYVRSIIFEGCAESKDYGSATVESGPDGVFAIVGEKTSLRRGARELGTLEGVSFVRFAPR